MEVWEEIAQSPEGGCHRLVSEYGKRLYGLCLSLCGNPFDANDLYQEMYKYKNMLT